METQTATIKVSNGVIRLPERLAQLLNGRDVVITQINDVVVVKPRQSYESYSDEKIAEWKADDALPYALRPKANAMDVLNALEKIKGVLPADSDGIAYENNIRQEAESHFQNLQW